MLPKTWGNYGNRNSSPGANFPCHPPKPEWVKKKVIRLKALMLQAGCRIIAHAFNRLYGRKGMTVGKSYVNEVVKKHRYEIQILRRRIKHKRPRPVPHNLIWGVDLTGKTDASGKTRSILAIVEHCSRSCLTLAALADKVSITLLEYLIAAIRRYGKPEYVRTDNEAVFTSRLFCFGLWVLGIRYQRTEVACPYPRALSLASPFTLWQNGKVERFFGTLKEKLNWWEVASYDELAASLLV